MQTPSPNKKDSKPETSYRALRSSVKKCLFGARKAESEKNGVSSSSSSSAANKSQVPSLDEAEEKKEVVEIPPSSLRASELMDPMFVMFDCKLELEDFLTWLKANPHPHKCKILRQGPQVVLTKPPCSHLCIHGPTPRSPTSSPGPFSGYIPSGLMCDETFSYDEEKKKEEVPPGPYIIRSSAAEWAIFFREEDPDSWWEPVSDHTVVYPTGVTQAYILEHAVGYLRMVIPKADGTNYRAGFLAEFFSLFQHIQV